MLEKLGRIRLLYIVLGVLLLVGLLPLAFAGAMLAMPDADATRDQPGFERVESRRHRRQRPRYACR